MKNTCIMIYRAVPNRININLLILDDISLLVNKIIYKNMFARFLLLWSVAWCYWTRWVICDLFLLYTEISPPEKFSTGECQNLNISNNAFSAIAYGALYDFFLQR